VKLLSLGSILLSTRSRIVHRHEEVLVEEIDRRFLKHLDPTMRSRSVVGLCPDCAAAMQSGLLNRPEGAVNLREQLWEIV